MYKKKIKKIIFKTQGKPSILTQHLRNPSAKPAVAFPRWAVPLLGAGWEVLKASFLPGELNPNMSKPGEEGQVMQELVLNRLIATSGAVGCPPPAQEAPPSWGQINPHRVAEMSLVLLEEGCIHWLCGLCPVRNWDFFFFKETGEGRAARGAC